MVGAELVEEVDFVSPEPETEELEGVAFAIDLLYSSILCFHSFFRSLSSIQTSFRCPASLTLYSLRMFFMRVSRIAITCFRAWVAAFSFAVAAAGWELGGSEVTGSEVAGSEVASAKAAGAVVVTGCCCS